jgi:hypothetical protein
MKCEKCNNEHDGKYGSGRFCSRQCANSRRLSKEVYERISKKLKRRIQRLCVCGETFETTPGSKKIYHKNSCKYIDKKFLERFSNSLKGKTGGPTKGGGRGKHGWYKGFWCDSSWELAFIISHLDNGIKIKRNTKKFSYEFKDKKYNYIPDFIVRGIYIEIKGYKTKRFDAKQEWFPKDLKYQVLYKDDMQIYLDYVVKKYGKDFIKLYNYAGLV